MEEDSPEIRLIRILHLGEVLNKVQPILKQFMIAKTGSKSESREYMMAFAILERIHYTAQGCLPSAIELRYNHHATLPLSHLFRVMIQEIITAYWLFDGNFITKIASLNSEFVVRNDKRLREMPSAPDEAYMQTIHRGWADIAPDNFEIKDDKVKLKSRKEIDFTQFSSIADAVVTKSKDLNMLYLGYIMLSQQAHISEFSREIIYNKQESNIRLFHMACRPILAACIMLVNKLGDAAKTIVALESLHEEYFPSAPKG